jgi:hypothetical protein
MGRFIARCALIEQRFGCVVAVVHHMGKDPSRGGRGSNALNGAVDVTWQVEKGEARNTVTITEMKDGPEGQTWSFRLAPIDLDRNILPPSETCSETSTCFVELLSEASHAKQSETVSARPPRGVDGDLLKIIKRAIDEAGETNAGGLDVPPNVRAVSRDMLKKYCATTAWQDPDEKPDAFRAALSRSLRSLRSRDLIGMDAQHIWLT